NVGGTEPHDLNRYRGRSDTERRRRHKHLAGVPGVEDAATLEHRELLVRAAPRDGYIDHLPLLVLGGRRERHAAAQLHRVGGAVDRDLAELDLLLEGDLIRAAGEDADDEQDRGGARQ